MVGATDLFFTVVLSLIVGFVVLAVFTATLVKAMNWLDDRASAKCLVWLLKEFDRQSVGVLSVVETFENKFREDLSKPDEDVEDFKAEIAHLRWSLATSRYFFSDLERFRKNGAPILLVWNVDDVRPRLLLGISAVGKEVALSEGSILPKSRLRPRLSEEEIQCLRESYPNLFGDAFSKVYSLYREDDEKRIDQYSEEERSWK